MVMGKGRGKGRREGKGGGKEGYQRGREGGKSQGREAGMRKPGDKKNLNKLRLNYSLELIISEYCPFNNYCFKSFPSSLTWSLRSSAFYLKKPITKNRELHQKIKD